MKILCFGHTIDPAFVTSKYAKNLVVLLPKHSKHLSKFFKFSDIKYFDCKPSVVIEDYSDAELLKKPEVIKIVKNLNCTDFLVSHRSSTELFKQCLKLNLNPIGNNPYWGEKLENKLFFDSLLGKLKIKKPSSIKYTLSKIKNDLMPIVVQDVTSFGSFGTAIIKSEIQLSEVKNKFKSSQKNLLIRKFINGHVYGITMVIHNKGIILSSIRQQCYFEKSDLNSDLTFAGIQWICRKYFKSKTIKTIEKSCSKIGKYLNKNKFRGIIHFDFMVDNNHEVFFLECNPRPSSATPQLLNNPSLIHNIDFSPILLHSFDKLPNKSTIPNSEYRGSLLDLMISKINCKNLKLNSAANTKDIKYFYSIKRLSSSRKPSFLGSIISDKTLFTSGGKLNEFGKKLYSKYTGIVI